VGYIEKNLVPGETVLYKTRLHGIVLIGPLVLAILPKPVEARVEPSRNSLRMKGT
jgi:hypothetical protein